MRSPTLPNPYSFSYSFQQDFLSQMIKFNIFVNCFYSYFLFLIREWKKYSTIDTRVIKKESLSIFLKSIEKINWEGLNYFYWNNLILFLIILMGSHFNLNNNICSNMIEMNIDPLIFFVLSFFFFLQIHFVDWIFIVFNKYLNEIEYKKKKNGVRTSWWRRRLEKGAGWDSFFFFKKR